MGVGNGHFTGLAPFLNVVSTKVGSEPLGHSVPSAPNFHNDTVANDSVDVLTRSFPFSFIARFASDGGLSPGA